MKRSAIARGVTLLAVSSACGGSTATVSNKWIGTWIAVSVGGAPLPATALQLGTGHTQVVSRSMIISGGAFSSWADSTVLIQNTPPNLNLSGTGEFDFAQTSDSTIDATRHNPCLCSGSMFFDRVFAMAPDGTIHARIDASDGPLTVFRKQ